jgi:hypothetical protein
VNENVFASFVISDKTKTFGFIEKFYCTIHNLKIYCKRKLFI